jgi:hypothetical protein
MKNATSQKTAFFIFTAVKTSNPKTKKKTPLPESWSQLYRPSDRRSSAKLVPTFADRGSHMVSVTDTYGRKTSNPTDN